MNNKKYKNDTKIILAGKDRNNKTSFVNSPIYKGSTVLFKNVGAMKKSIKNKNTQILSYGRFGNPTTFEFEKAIAKIDEGYSAVATASGTAAIVASLIAVLKTGDHILMTDSAYGVSRNLAKGLLSNMGIATTFYKPNIGKEIANLIKPNTKVIFMESPGSLTFEIQDIPMLVELAKKYNLITIIDNTWATSLFFKPLSNGIDISIQSATKYIIGHSDAMLGVITTNKKYTTCVREAAHNLGSCPGSEDIYLGIRGLKTLSLRLQKHQENTLKVIEWLKTQEVVDKIFYPALPDNVGYKIWKRDFLGSSGLFGVILKKTKKSLVNKMLNNLKLFNMGYSWGGYESLIIPIEPEKERDTYDWKNDCGNLRLHIGLEDSDDLINDLKDNFSILKGI
ncbi:MAG: cystathionine beta-lyase [Pelagibacterales bacterium]|nr:cystathionine beta-lyase [Pelagibacterales bacterium]|tara:strand:+ start:127 stop:1308 length:1182 start_codon:yes stop_codon:yes gene_type:complete